MSKKFSRRNRNSIQWPEEGYNFGFGTALSQYLPLQMQMRSSCIDSILGVCIAAANFGGTFDDEGRRRTHVFLDAVLDAWDKHSDALGKQRAMSEAV